VGPLVTALLSLLSAGLTLLAAVTAPLFWLDEERLRAALAEQAAAVLGREVAIGDLEIRGGWELVAAVSDVRVANPDWAETPAFLRLERGMVAVDLWTSWRERRLVLRRVELTDPRLWLEREADGRRNWRFDRLSGEGAPAQAAPRPPAWLTLDALTLASGRLVVRDAPTRTDAELTELSLDASLSASGEARLTASGRLDGDPVRLRASGDPVEDGGAYRLDVDSRLDEARLAVSGALDGPGAAPTAWAVRFEAPTLAGLPEALGLPVPDTPPVRLSGSLTQTEEALAVRGLEGSVGESAFEGVLRWEATALRPLLTGRLTFAPLRAEDFAGVVGAGPDDPPVVAGRGPLPEVRFDADRLFTLDADLELAAAEVAVPEVPVTGFSGRLVIEDGRLEMDPLRVEIARGTATGEAALNGRETPPSADLDLAFDEVELRPFFRETRFADELSGALDGELYVLGVGASVDALLASARGDAYVRMTGGSLSGLAVEALGLDVIEALALAVGADTRVPINCAVADLEISDGRARVQRAVIDTADSVIDISGQIDLTRETFVFDLRADAKDFSLIDATAPVRVAGPFLNPSVQIGPLEGIPLFELGDAPDVACPPPGAE
jgi:hypothetical protein